MPNIQGEYSLSETALKVGASTAWINKIQSRTKICEKDGERGRRATFTEEDIKTLINVKLLRALDYEISEIAEIYRKEEAMMSLYARVFPGPLLSGDSSYIIHTYTFYYPFDGDNTSEALNEETMNAHEELAHFIFKISKEVARRAEALAGDLTGIKQKMMKNIENFRDRE